MHVHLVARLDPPHDLLASGQSARWLWQRLRERFPHALAAVVLPNHLHLIADAGPDAAAALAPIVASAAQRFAPRGLGVVRHASPTARPVPLHELEDRIIHVLRNPVRAGYTDDPLRWEWTTLRDVVGATVDPWITAGRLATTLGRWPRRFVEDFCGECTRDPRTGQSTPCPRPVRRSPRPRYSLPALWLATTMALRGLPRDRRRRDLARVMFLQLADHQGYGRDPAVARAAGASPRTHERIVALPDASLLGPALVCLGDERLRRGPQARPGVGRARTRVAPILKAAPAVKAALRPPWEAVG
jgi:hypothetical protein